MNRNSDTDARAGGGQAGAFAIGQLPVRKLAVQLPLHAATCCKACCGACLHEAQRNLGAAQQQRQLVPQEAHALVVPLVGRHSGCALLHPAPCLQEKQRNVRAAPPGCAPAGRHVGCALLRPVCRIRSAMCGRRMARWRRARASSLLLWSCAASAWVSMCGFCVWCGRAARLSHCSTAMRLRCIPQGCDVSLRLPSCPVCRMSHLCHMPHRRPLPVRQAAVAGGDAAALPRGGFQVGFCVSHCVLPSGP